MVVFGQRNHQGQAVSNSASFGEPLDVASILQSHNTHRCQHGTPPLNWSIALSQVFGKYLAKGCPYAHQQSGHGENIYWASDWNVDDTAPLQLWYDGEVGKYNYASPLDMSKGAALHFTQVVWKSTHEVACVKCHSTQSSGVVTFCMYNPPGNVWSSHYFSTNVPVPLHSTAECHGPARPLDTHAFVRAHATARCPHGAPALGWSNALAAEVAGWALQCPTAPAPLAGANLYTSATQPSASDVVGAWRTAAHLFDQARPAPSEATRQFAQLVWRSATEFACGMCQDAQRTYHVMCKYNVAASDVESELQSNVLPADPSKQCSDHAHRALLTRPPPPPTSTAAASFPHAWIVAVLFAVPPFCVTVLQADPGMRS